MFGVAGPARYRLLHFGPIDASLGPLRLQLAQAAPEAHYVVPHQAAMSGENSPAQKSDAILHPVDSRFAIVQAQPDARQILLDRLARAACSFA